MPLIDCCVKEINRHVCDRLLLNAAKHGEIESDVQNANALDISQIYNEMPLLTALTKGAVDLNK